MLRGIAAEAPPLYFICGLCDSPLEQTRTGSGNGFFMEFECPNCPSCRVVICQEAGYAMDSIKFNVPGVPCAWARARTAGKMHFTPGKQRQAMAIASQIAAEAMGEQAPLTGPVSMSIMAVWPWPKSMSDKKRKALGANWRASRPDTDNIGKLVADSLNGIVFLDDAQVVRLTIEKQFGTSAFTRVSIEPLTEVEA
jgi:Holliday junction resolvase RusA-like endonuclease